MIPNNIELPDDVIRELTSNPILLRWLSSIQSQLITSTVEENGVGCTRLIKNKTGATIVNLEDVPASGLKILYFDSSGALLESSVVLEGVWRQASGGAIANNQTKMMTRVR